MLDEKEEEGMGTASIVYGETNVFLQVSQNSDSEIPDAFLILSIVF